MPTMRGFSKAIGWYLKGRHKETTHSKSTGFLLKNPTYVLSVKETEMGISPIMVTPPCEINFWGVPSPKLKGASLSNTGALYLSQGIPWLNDHAYVTVICTLGIRCRLVKEEPFVMGPLDTERYGRGPFQGWVENRGFVGCSSKTAHKLWGKQT